MYKIKMNGLNSRQTHGILQLIFAMMRRFLHNSAQSRQRYQWKPSRSLATVSGLLGQVRKKAAKVGIAVCRE